jgi:hypothetical protein
VSIHIKVHRKKNEKIFLAQIRELRVGRSLDWRRQSEKRIGDAAQHGFIVVEH